MSRLLKRRLASAVAICAVLAAGAAVALGATGEGGHPHKASPSHGLIAEAASYLGIGRAQLLADLRSGKSLAQVAASTPSRTEAGLVAAILADLKAKREARLVQRVSALVKSSGTELVSPRGSARSVRALALPYLGLSHRQLAAQLREGRSLAQIAGATPGRSATGLTEAILAAEAKRLDAAAKAGRITQARARARLARLRTLVPAEIDRVHSARSSSQSG